MSTVADDLLNDFGSSGDEAEDQENDGLAQTEDATTERDANAMDVDGEQDEDEDAQNGVADLNDTEATKAKVEKMQLGAVKDVRSVASLMQTLEPVLEVSDPPSSRHPVHVGRSVYIL
jgi:U4/U6 small nuclear ribonucleoprotein PRP31